MNRNHAIDDVPEHWNHLSREVIAAAMEVHSMLGTGLLERLYGDALAVELSLRKIDFQREVPIRMSYKGVPLTEQCMDFVVGGFLILELKAVEAVHQAHLAQLVSYLRSSRLPLGLILNFHAPRLKDGLFRRINTNGPLPDSFLDLEPHANASLPSAFLSSPRTSAPPRSTPPSTC